MTALCAAAAVVLALGLESGAAQTPVDKRLQPYVAANKLYALQKPADWNVKEEPRPDSFRILVNSPDGASTVDLFWTRNDQKGNVLGLLAEVRQYLAQTNPDVSFSEVYVSRDSARGLATVRFHAGKTPVKGRYYFESSAARLSAQGYCAPETSLATQRPLLLNVMASVAFTKVKGTAPAPQVQFIQAELVPHRAADGSLSIKIPADWNFMGSGGKVIAGAPGGGAGFIFTSISGNPMLRNASIAQGVIASRYRPPGQALTVILQAFGHRGVNIQSTQPDRATNQQFQAAAGRRCDAQDVVASWTSSKGAACLGGIKVINALPSPTGLWFCMMAGVWAPEQDFSRYLPMLEQISDSFSIKDQYAKGYIHAGLDNLRRLQQQTANSINDLNRAREQNQRDWEARQDRKDFMESKWDDYRRGNTYWVSDLEGGRVYHTDNWGTRDTLTGDYYEGRAYNWTNFEGQNPRYPSEDMHEVSSYELQKLTGRP